MAGLYMRGARVGKTAGGATSGVGTQGSPSPLMALTRFCPCHRWDPAVPWQPPWPPRTDRSGGPRGGTSPQHSLKTVHGEKRMGQGQGPRGLGGQLSQRADSPHPHPSQHLLHWPSQPRLPFALTGMGGGPDLGLGVLETHRGLSRTRLLLRSLRSLFLALRGHPTSKGVGLFFLPRQNAKQGSQPLAPFPTPRTCRFHPCFPANQLLLGCGQGHLSVRALGQSVDLTSTTVVLP